MCSFGVGKGRRSERKRAEKIDSEPNKQELAFYWIPVRKIKREREKETKRN